MEHMESMMRQSSERSAAFPDGSRRHKERLFRRIFKEPERLLELYNALNGTNYDQPGELTAAALESAVYMGMKNDLAFVVHSQMSLYEHQFLYNPNLPLKDLLYVAGIYAEHVGDRNLYGAERILLPAPQFVVFYNGLDAVPERSVMRLSDSFERVQQEPALELNVLVLNITPGNNGELMERCRTLREYSAYVGKVREYCRVMSLKQAVECAVTECIREGILEEFLTENREEAAAMSIFEYNEELDIRQEREAAREDGYCLGKKEGIQEGYRLGLREGEQRGRLEGEKRGRLEGELKGRREGERRGRSEGERIKQHQIARRMKAAREPLEKIALYTGLSLEEVRLLMLR